MRLVNETAAVCYCPRHRVESSTVDLQTREHSRVLRYGERCPWIDVWKYLGTARPLSVVVETSLTQIYRRHTTTQKTTCPTEYQPLLALQTYRRTT